MQNMFGCREVLAWFEELLWLNTEEFSNGPMIG